MFGFQQVSKRFSHGHHLTPQDANEERPRRRRHRSSHGDRERKYYSPERGYRSDDEPRRRHSHDERKDRHRASSSYRPKVDDRRKSWSSYQLREDQSDEPPVRRSDTAMYDDHHESYLLKVEAFPKRSRLGSRREPYGEHRFDDGRVTKTPSIKTSSAARYTTNLSPLPPSPANERISGSTSNHEGGPPHLGNRDDINKQATSSRPSTSHTYSAPLPSRVRDSAFASGERSPQDNLDRRQSTSGPSETFNSNSQVPHLSFSQHPTDYSPPPFNAVASDSSKPEASDDRPIYRSDSRASIRSSKLASRSPSLSGSGVLGPEVYQYQPLQASEIRLVRVLPKTMSELKCQIVHVLLDEQPHYTAISYAWGDAVDKEELVLEGATIPVAASLYNALIAVRRKKEGILVWVDALCIDQQNKDERATQVRLMGQIYRGAASVAIWIGPEYEESVLAMQLLEKVALNSIDPQHVKSTLSPDSLALFNLFKRDYWKRLWVVQEVLLSSNKMVYCGHSVFPWEVYQKAAEIFWDKDSDPHIRQGPSSFPDRDTLKQLGDESLLEVMQACRKKLSENPRDKVFGILGLLSDTTQRDFPVDYSRSIKSVYTDVVDHLISTTDRLDVIREAIHFPLHANSTGLPSWCPDWSHIPEVSGLARTLNFAASNNAKGPTSAQYWFHDKRRKLEISAIRIDTVTATGVAVGTLCAAQDYLTVFLQWRAMLLHELNIKEGDESHPVHKAFCRTICLGQVPPEWSQPQAWQDICYHVFAALVRERMPRFPMDEDLRRYVGATGLIEPQLRRKFLQDHFGNRMMGRSLCITENGLIGMGSGYMAAKDIVVVPFGCSTPILLRPLGPRNEYNYVGDVYIDGYMNGEAVAQMEAKDPKMAVSKYILC